VDGHGFPLCLVVFFILKYLLCLQGHLFLCVLKCLFYHILTEAIIKEVTFSVYGLMGPITSTLQECKQLHVPLLSDRRTTVSGLQCEPATPLPLRSLYYLSS
jgi:hypothetical protein